MTSIFDLRFFIQTLLFWTLISLSLLIITILNEEKTLQGLSEQLDKQTIPLSFTAAAGDHGDTGHNAGHEMPKGDHADPHHATESTNAHGEHAAPEHHETGHHEATHDEPHAEAKHGGSHDVPAHGGHDAAPQHGDAHHEDAHDSSDHSATGHSNEHATKQSVFVGVPSLREKTPYGYIPKIANNGLTAFSAYQQSFFADGKKPIAIALKDYGVSESQSMKALEMLPVPSSLLLSPYATNPDKWRDLALEKGHELWLELPVRGIDLDVRDTGPNSINVFRPFSEVKDQLHKLLAISSSYAGIALYSPYPLTTNETSLEPFLEEISMRGLAIFDMNDEKRSMQAEYEPLIVNNLDAYFPKPDSMQQSWNKQGYLTVTISPTDTVLQSIPQVLAKLQNEGVAIAPLSAMYQIQK